MKSTRPDAEPRQLQLERLALDELSADEVRELRESIGAERLDEMRRALEADSASVLAELPPERLVPSIERQAAAASEVARARERRATRRRLAWSVSAVAAIGGALAIWAGALETSGTGPDGVSLIEDSTRIKGLGSNLRVYRQRDSNHDGTAIVERLEDGDIASSGDVVQLGYVAAGHPFGVIVSIDGAGAVTLHAPDDPEAPSRLEQGGEVLLRHAFQLDDAPSFERFFFVTADSPIPPMRVLNSAADLARDPVQAVEEPLSLPEGWDQVSVVLWKEQP